MDPYDLDPHFRIFKSGPILHGPIFSIFQKWTHILGPIFFYGFKPFGATFLIWVQKVQIWPKKLPMAGGLRAYFLGAGGWGRGLMRRELGFGGWDGGYWLPAVRCGLGASPELSHRFCCVLKFGNLLFSASIQKVYQTIVNSILSPPLPHSALSVNLERGGLSVISKTSELIRK